MELFARVTVPICCTDCLTVTLQKPIEETSKIWRTPNIWIKRTTYDLYYIRDCRQSATKDCRMNQYSYENNGRRPWNKLRSPLSVPLVSPQRRPTVLLVNPLKGDVFQGEQVLLRGSTQVSLVTKLDVMHIGCGQIIGTYDTCYATKCMKFVAVVVHVLYQSSPSSIFGHVHFGTPSQAWSQCWIQTLRRQWSLLWTYGYSHQADGSASCADWTADG